MTTKELGDYLHEKGHVGSKADGAKVAAAFIQGVMNALADGEDVDLHGLGKLKVKARAARTGRNPATGASLEIPAKKALAFKPSKAFIVALNGC